VAHATKQARARHLVREDGDMTLTVIIAMLTTVIGFACFIVGIATGMNITDRDINRRFLNEKNARKRAEDFLNKSRAALKECQRRNHELLAQNIFSADSRLPEEKEETTP
jgi:hypothetical protein